MRKRVLSFFLCTTSLMVLQANAGTTKTLPKERIGVLLKNYVLQNKAKNCLILLNRIWSRLM